MTRFVRIRWNIRSLESDWVKMILPPTTKTQSTQKLTCAQSGQSRDISQRKREQHHTCITANQHTAVDVNTNSRRARLQVSVPAQIANQNRARSSVGSDNVTCIRALAEFSTFARQRAHCPRDRRPNYEARRGSRTASPRRSSDQISAQEGTVKAGGKTTRKRAYCHAVVSPVSAVQLIQNDCNAFG